MNLANLGRLRRTRDFRRGMAVDGQKLQCFALLINNNSGTLRHAFLGDISALGIPAYCDRIIGVRQDFQYANTPTVSASVDFVNGGGIVSGATDRFCFNTAEQTFGLLIEQSHVEYYSGNVVRPRALLAFVSRNVNGITRRRLELQLTNDITGAAWNINTTNIPSGLAISVRAIVALQ